LEDLCASDGKQPRNAEQGRKMLARRLGGRTVLLVVDNMWGDQLEMLLPGDILEVLAESSMVLATSRESAAADAFVGKETTDARLLSGSESLQLFCQHAYGSTEPPADDQEQVRGAVARCGGLPMALEVVGRHLRLSRDRRGVFKEVEAAFASAYAKDRAERKDGERTLFAALRLSWDALDAEEQEALLDIAWFLNGRNSDWVAAHCGYGVLDRLCRLGWVTRWLAGYDWRFHCFTYVATVHDTISELCRSDVGISRHPRRLMLTCSSGMRKLGELQEQVTVHSWIHLIYWFLTCIHRFDRTIPS
jgi:hypothetical protein